MIINSDVLDLIMLRSQRLNRRQFWFVVAGEPESGGVVGLSVRGWRIRWEFMRQVKVIVCRVARYGLPVYVDSG